MNPLPAARRLGLVAILLVAACSSHPEQQLTPSEVIRNSGNTVAEAEDARASDYAPKEMHAAREKFQAAQELSRKAHNDGNPAEMEQARWLAEEASADAKLAEAKAQNSRLQGLLRDRQRPAEPAPAPSDAPPPEPVPPPGTGS